MKLTEQEVRNLNNVPVIYTGNQYAPVKHVEVIETIRDYINSQGLTILKEEYNANTKSQQLIGKFMLDNSNTEIKPMISFKNSQDGKISFGICSGTVCFICTNGQIFGDTFQYKRKHTGNGHKEILESIKYAVEGLELKLKQHQEIANQLKEVKLDTRTISTLCGRLFLEDKIVQSEQLNLIKQELEKPTFNYGNPESAWEFYNHCTFALRDAAPRLWHKQHQQLGNFFQQEYQLV